MADALDRWQPHRLDEGWIDGEDPLATLPPTAAFIFHPPRLAAPSRPVVGAAAVHDVLLGWRRELNGAQPLPSLVASGHAGSDSGLP